MIGQCGACPQQGGVGWDWSYATGLEDFRQGEGLSSWGQVITDLPCAGPVNDMGPDLSTLSDTPT